MKMPMSTYEDAYVRLCNTVVPVALISYIVRELLSAQYRIHHCHITIVGQNMLYYTRAVDIYVFKQ